MSGVVKRSTVIQWRCHAFGLYWSRPFVIRTTVCDREIRDLIRQMNVAF